MSQLAPPIDLNVVRAELVGEELDSLLDPLIADHVPPLGPTRPGEAPICRMSMNPARSSLIFEDGRGAAQQPRQSPSL